MREGGGAGLGAPIDGGSSNAGRSVWRVPTGGPRHSCTPASQRHAWAAATTRRLGSGSRVASTKTDGERACCSSLVAAASSMFAARLPWRPAKQGSVKRTRPCEPRLWGLRCGCERRLRGHGNPPPGTRSKQGQRIAGRRPPARGLPGPGPSTPQHTVFAAMARCRRALCQKPSQLPQHAAWGAQRAQRRFPPCHAPTSIPTGGVPRHIAAQSISEPSLARISTMKCPAGPQASAIDRSLASTGPSAARPNCRRPRASHGDEFSDMLQLDDAWGVARGRRGVLQAAVAAALWLPPAAAWRAGSTVVRTTWA